MKPTQEQVIEWAHEAGLHIATEVHWMPIIGLKYLEKATALAYKAGRAALATEQEPKAFYVYKPTLPRGNLGNVADGDLPWVYDQDPSSGYSARMLVYITPPQREWVGLTDEEYESMAEKYVTDYFFDTLKYARAIETKLRVKNGNL